VVVVEEVSARAVEALLPDDVNQFLVVLVLLVVVLLDHYQRVVTPSVVVMELVVVEVQ
jgi:hypothetical protein